MGAVATPILVIKGEEKLGMEVRGNYIIFDEKDTNIIQAVKKDEIAGMYSFNENTVSIYLSGNRNPTFSVSCTIDEILSKIEPASHNSCEDKSAENKAAVIACDLMLGAVIYGIDSDRLFEIVMNEEGLVYASNMAEWIEKNIDRFSDDDEVRNKAIEKLGF